LDVPLTYGSLKINDFKEFKVYPDELRETYKLWNNSYGLSLEWDSMKSNLEDPFLVLKDAGGIDDDYCKKLKKWGDKVPSGASTKAEVCKDHFQESNDTGVEKKCKQWVKDRTDMNTAVTLMLQYTTAIHADWKVYNAKYVADMIYLYDITNENQQTLASQPIIKDVMSYWHNRSDNEINCFAWKMEDQLIFSFTMCKPIFKIIHNTMNYFCDYMVTSMTLAWMSQGLLGLVLALHMLVASTLSSYFIKMETRHDDDISDEEKAKAFD